MKKISLLVAVTIITVSTLFISSCAKKADTDLTKDVVGTYVGRETYDIGGSSNTNPGITFVVSRIDDTHIKLNDPTGSYLDMTATVGAIDDLGDRTFSIMSFTDGGSIWEPIEGSQGYRPFNRSFFFTVHVTSGSGIGDFFAYEGIKQ